MNNLISINDTKIKQDGQGRYCLNDLHKASGGNPIHAPSQFLRLKGTKEFVAVLDSHNANMHSAVIEDKFLYRQSGNLLPYQSAHSRDLFAVKTGTAEHGHNFTQTRVTSKGIELIASRYASELMQ